MCDNMNMNRSNDMQVRSMSAVRAVSELRDDVREHVLNRLHEQYRDNKNEFVKDTNLVLYKILNDYGRNVNFDGGMDKKVAPRIYIRTQRPKEQNQVDSINNISFSAYLCLIDGDVLSAIDLYSKEYRKILELKGLLRSA